jgi:hypothetical protein
MGRKKYSIYRVATKKLQKSEPPAVGRGSTIQSFRSSDPEQPAPPSCVQPSPRTIAAASLPFSSTQGRPPLAAPCTIDLPTGVWGVRSVSCHHPICSSGGRRALRRRNRTRTSTASTDDAPASGLTDSAPKLVGLKSLHRDRLKSPASPGHYVVATW